MNYFKTAFIFSLLFCNIGISQISKEWTQSYNGPENYIDFSYDIAGDSEGNVYVTGVSNEFYATIKYNSTGQELWVRRETVRHGRAEFIAVDDSGNVYITGYRQRINTFNRDVVTIKYNSQGTLQWLQSYSVPKSIDNYPRDMCIDNLSNIYITGYTVDSVHREYITVKYDSNGKEIWSHNYGSVFTQSFDQANSIAVSASGNVYVTGIFDRAMTTLKYDDAGNLMWTESYPVVGAYTAANKVAVDENENVYICGVMGISGELVFTTIKYNSSGSIIWVKEYFDNNSTRTSAKTMVLDSSGNIYVTGNIVFSPGSSQYLTIKYNSNGDQVWVKQFQGQHFDSHVLPSDISIDDENNIYITGDDNSRAGIYTVKYNSSGQEAWNIVNDQLGVQGDVKLFVDVNNIYIAGKIYEQGENYNFLTTKYSQKVGINSIVNATSLSYYLGQNYPNPFNPKTVISYSLIGNGYISLKVFDILGNEVAVLVNEKQNAGSYAVDFNGEGLPSGIYFYKLNARYGQAGDFVETKRMILLK
ncbi:MAG: SBBP repeat-containing protein [Bacteroidota bacterium]|nr:SBBP repeat-containing protein [Bacteroidota bacterium]